MITLFEIQRQTDTFLSQVLALTRLPMGDLLERAHATGPIGGCMHTFSPLYVFDACRADCSYCGFRRSSEFVRKILTEDETRREALVIKSMGVDAAYVLGGSLTAWSESSERALSSQAQLAERGVRAVSDMGLFPIVEMSPFSLYELTHLAGAVGRGRFVLFQETYNDTTYRSVHAGSSTLRFKGTPEERVLQMTTALNAGWREIGIGVLLGLAPNLWHDVAATLVHAHALLELGAELVTISVPRLNSAIGARTDARCTDQDFIRAVAIYSILGRAVASGRIKVVITGRETPTMRDDLALLTDIWGIRGSTTPGGYTIRPQTDGGQFSLVDRRTLTEIRAAHATRHTL